MSAEGVGRGDGERRGGSGKRRNEIHVALRWKQKERKRERTREGGKEKENGVREGEVGKSHTAVNEPPPTPSADCTYVRTYVPTLAMLPAYVRT